MKNNTTGLFCGICFIFFSIVAIISGIITFMSKSQTNIDLPPGAIGGGEAILWAINPYAICMIISVILVCIFLVAFVLSRK